MQTRLQKGGERKVPPAHSGGTWEPLDGIKRRSPSEVGVAIGRIDSPPVTD